MVHEKSADEIMLIAESGPLRAVGEQKKPRVFNAPGRENEKPGGDLKFPVRPHADPSITDGVVTQDQLQQGRVQIDRNAFIARQRLAMVSGEDGASAKM